MEFSTNQVVELMPHTIASSIEKFYIVGGSRRSEDVKESLSELAVAIIEIDNVNHLLNKISHQASGVIFVEPLIGLHTGIRTLQASRLHRKIPIHVVTTNSCDDENARRLYRMGATSVTAFPLERSVFSQMIKNLRTEGPDYNDQPSVEGRISKAIWARTQPIVESAKQLRVWFHSGIVHLVGEMNSYAKQEQLEKIIKRAPGVIDVTRSGLTMSTNATTDRELENRLNSTIREYPGAHHSTILCSVTGGNAIIAGTAIDKATARYIEQKINAMPGIKSISNLMTVSKRGWQRDKQIAKQLSDHLSRFFANSKIDITILNRVAILRGHVAHHSTQKMIEDMVTQFEGVRRVINKIKVAY